MSARTAPVVVIGELLVDIVHTPDGQTAEHVGGSPANVALGLARLGHDTWFATLVGTDARGIRCTEHVEAGGVKLLPGSTNPAHPTSTAAATRCSAWLVRIAESCVILPCTSPLA